MSYSVSTLLIKAIAHRTDVNLPVSWIQACLPAKTRFTKSSSGTSCAVSTFLQLS
jgi:hypothetical protein